ncbi:MAG: PAS domain S-box protein [Lentisphaerae bacterium]|nr:PAS domain S-box protein [Lentisphaerota bacterium]
MENSATTAHDHPERLTGRDWHGVATLYAIAGIVYSVLSVGAARFLVPAARLFEAVTALALLFVVLSTLYLVGVARRVRQAAQRDARALQASEQRYRLIAENASDVVWTADSAGRFTYVSPSVQRLLGFTPAEIMALAARPPEPGSLPIARNEALARIHQQLIEQDAEQPVTMELCDRHRDGHDVWVEVVARVIRDADGRPAGILGASRDITRRRLAQEALREQQAEQQAILDALPACVFQKDLANRVVWANRAWVENTGKSRDQIIGKSCDDIFPREVAERFALDDAEVIRTDRPKTDILLRVPAPDGTGPWYTVRKIPWHDGDGKVIGVLGCSLDVTSLREAEVALRHSEQRFRTLFTASPLGIILSDERGRILDANPACVRLLGYSLDELRALPSLASLLAADDVTAGRAWLRALAVAGSGMPPREFVALRRDGETVCTRHVGAVVRDEGGRFLYSLDMIEDMTETKQLEERLRHSQKIEAIGRLAGGIAHDFNNLLQVVLSCTGEALAGLDESAPLHLPLHQSEQAARRAASLTRQLLAFSRQQILQPVRLDVRHLIQELLSLLNRLIGEAICIDFQPGDGVGPVMADANQIEQVLINLCVNARDAMPGGGMLTLSTLEVTLGPEDCDRRDLMQPGIYVAVQVQDTGEGMDEGTMARVFDPFFTTKAMGKGTGLGLAVAYGIARQHGGTITASSRPGQGSTFTLLLPRCDHAPMPAPTPATAAAPPPGGQGETVLVAEDEALVRDICRRMLERAGYRVMVASHGLEAVRIVRANPGAIDLLVFDAVMPIMGGREAYETICR